MKNNPEKYKWGMIYFDPKDSRIIVPKIDMYRGWTFNFGHPVSYIIMLIFIALLIVFT